MLQFTIAQKIAIWALPVLFAITVHEVAHGWVASKFGDQTAKLSGRLTLNPIKHIDLIGTILVPLTMLFVSNFIFGWAKPVPVDARNLHHPRRDMAIVAFAGPLSNFTMAIIWALIAKIGFGLVDVQPWLGLPLTYMGQAGIMINVVLAVLNLLPIPPLDGGRVVTSLLPGKLAWYFSRIEPFGFIILVVLIFTGVLSSIIAPFVFSIIRSITVLFGL